MMLISELNKPEVAQLEEIRVELPIQLALQQEFLEAYELGKQTLHGINNVLSILINGKGFWGQWSTTHTLSGTHDPISDAIELSIKIQPQLDKFQQELTDISRHFSYRQDLQTPKDSNSFTFMFLYSRGLGGTKFTNLGIQSRIKKWLAHLQKLQQRMDSKVSMLERELGILQRRIKKLETEKQSIITQHWNESSFTSEP
ncbi:MAG: hypothetical protein HC804_07760 [Anaerolineae bacterium]|nr:hypothetical protein [Anaerolineae bacterium]